MMRQHRWGLTIGTLVLVIAGISLLLYLKHVQNAKTRLMEARLMEDYLGESQRYHQLLMNLHDRRPRQGNLEAWQGAIQMLFVAGYSSGLGKTTQSVASFRQINDDFDSRLKGEPGPETLRWLWGRLSQSGNAGKEHADEIGGVFEEVVSQCEAEEKE